MNYVISIFLLIILLHEISKSPDDQNLPPRLINEVYIYIQLKFFLDKTVPSECSWLKAL